MSKLSIPSKLSCRVGVAQIARLLGCSGVTCYTVTNRQQCSAPAVSHSNRHHFRHVNPPPRQLLCPSLDTGSRDTWQRRCQHCTSIICASCQHANFSAITLSRPAQPFTCSEFPPPSAVNQLCIVQANGSDIVTHFVPNPMPARISDGVFSFQSASQLLPLTPATHARRFEVHSSPIPSLSPFIAGMLTRVSNCK